MSKLVLRMAPSSVPSVLRGWDEHDGRFDVALDSALDESTIVFVTEDEWACGDYHMKEYDRWMYLAGHALEQIDLDDMHDSIAGRHNFCERNPYACEVRDE